MRETSGQRWDRLVAEAERKGETVISHEGETFVCIGGEWYAWWHPGFRRGEPREVSR